MALGFGVLGFWGPSHQPGRCFARMEGVMEQGLAPLGGEGWLCALTVAHTPPSPSLPQSISSSPPESLQDEERTGLKRKREEKELPGHSVSAPRALPGGQGWGGGWGALCLPCCTGLVSCEQEQSKGGAPGMLLSPRSGPCCQQDVVGVGPWSDVQEKMGPSAVWGPGPEHKAWSSISLS